MITNKVRINQSDVAYHSHGDDDKMDVRSMTRYSIVQKDLVFVACQVLDNFNSLSQLLFKVFWTAAYSQSETHALKESQDFSRKQSASWL